MFVILLILLVGLALVALPQIWIHRVMERHAFDRPDLGGTGSEFARHALDALKLAHVKVEKTEQGNHYNPIAKAVRLEPRLINSRSLSASWSRPTRSATPYRMPWRCRSGCAGRRSPARRTS